MSQASINTSVVSESLRSRSINLDEEKLLITNFAGTQQEKDFTVPANCQGFGRIRHFYRATADGWPSNPLPIDPAAKALGVPSTNLLKAQVFQNASCNWRCWYCYVPFNLLSANHKHSAWLSCSELIDLYDAEPERPVVIDLSGGQPDLVPEWILWMMRELTNRGLAKHVYLWSDDNLSNDYFWRYLTDSDRRLISRYRNYGKVCCFKGFDRQSFAFNTKASPELFERQIELFQRYVELGIDVYGYATFTSPQSPRSDSMSRFMDALQVIHPELPLRVIPLEVRQFAPFEDRTLDQSHRDAMSHQNIAINFWQEELIKRFSNEQIHQEITEVRLFDQVKQ